MKNLTTKEMAMERTLGGGGGAGEALSPSSSDTDESLSASTCKEHTNINCKYTLDARRMVMNDIRKKPRLTVAEHFSPVS